MVHILMRYKKAVVAALGTVLSAILVAYLGDGAMSFQELVNIVILGAGAISVAVAPNVPGAKYVKAILAGIAAAATILLSVYTDGITTEEWAQMAVAAGTAAGVFQARNKDDYLERVGKHRAVV